MPEEDRTKHTIALTVYAVVRLHRAHMNNQQRRAAMTDNSVIEEAAKAIAEFAAHDGPVDAYHLAKVLYARFEQARTPSTPTDDERPTIELAR